MNKKILAVALAMLFIVTAFTACKSKLDMTEINGNEYPLATDKDGNTIINEENRIAVIVTDENEEVITYTDGEDQTYWLQLDGDYVTDDMVQGKLYKFGIIFRTLTYISLYDIMNNFSKIKTLDSNFYQELGIDKYTYEDIYKEVKLYE